MKIKIEIKRNYILIIGIILIIVSILFLKAVLIPGIKPDPGHLSDEIISPIGCNDDQVLIWSNSQAKWSCINYAGSGAGEPTMSIWLVHTDYKDLYDTNNWDYELPMVEPTAGGGKEHLGGWNSGPIKFFKFCALQSFDELDGGESESWHIDPTNWEPQGDKYAWAGWGENVPRAMKCMDW